MRMITATEDCESLANFCFDFPKVHFPPTGGSRFNGPERGAWYAAFELRTAQEEIAFHKAQELQEIKWTEPETFTFDDYLADFRADFHDTRVGIPFLRNEYGNDTSRVDSI
jgi:RES domain